MILEKTMAPFYKLLSNTINLQNAANTVFNAKLVRIVAKAPLTITLANSGGQIGSILMNGNTEFVIQKKPTDTLSSSDNNAGNTLVVAIGFTN